MGVRMDVVVSLCSVFAPRLMLSQCRCHGCCSGILDMQFRHPRHSTRETVCGGDGDADGDGDDNVTGDDTGDDWEPHIWALYHIRVFYFF